MSVGTIYTELDLDYTKFEKNQYKLLQSAKSTALSVEKNFQNLGVKSDKIFDAMRMSAKNSFEMIKNHAGSSAAEIARSQEALGRKLKAIDEEQFGKRTSMLDTFKKNWLAATAIIAGITATGMKVWGMAKAGAAFDEQFGILDNLAKKYETTADTIISEMDRASKHQIAKSELMSIALGGIAKGLTPEQLINLANAAETLGDVVGKTATEAMKGLTEALETGRARGLKNYLGAALDLEATFGDLAAKMTDAEKAQAMYNITMLAAIGIQNRQTKEIDGAADAIAEVEKKYDDAVLAASRFFKTVVAKMWDFYQEYIQWTNELWGVSNKFQPEVEGAPSVRMPMPKRDKSTTKYESNIDELKETLKARKDLEEGNKKLAKSTDEAARSEKAFADEIAKSTKQAQESLLVPSAAEIKMQEQISENRLNDIKAENALLEKRAELERKAYEKLEGLPYELPSEEYIKEHEEITRNLSKKMLDITETTAQAMEQNFGTFFFDVMKGNFDSLGDAAKGMLNSIQRAIADFLAGEVVKQLFGTMNASGQREGGLLASLIKWLAPVAAAAVGAPTTTDLGGGTTEMYGYRNEWHSGGIVGAGGFRIPRLHAGLKADEYPAILQQGEEVIPRSEVGKNEQSAPVINMTIQAVDAASFTELASRNPQAILGPFMNALRKGGSVVDTLRMAVR